MSMNKRTTSGCITCRIRRVKCGEERPSCQRCTSTGRRCDGYSTLPYSRKELLASASRSRNNNDYAMPADTPSASKNGPLSRSVNDPTFDDVWEKRCFQFFRHKTVSSSNALINSRFWERIVLQAVHFEPAIKHGVLALSIFDQSLSTNCDSFTNYRFQADLQYQRSLEHARRLLSTARERDIERILITCLLCIHYETVRGQFKASTQHMDNGRAIMRQYSQTIRQASRRSDLAEIQQAFARLDALQGSFSDRSTPYRSTLDDFHGTLPFLRAWEFSDVYEARSCLFDLSRWLLLARHQVCYAWLEGEVEVFRKYETERALCGARLEEWHSQFEALTMDANPGAELIFLTLDLWYTTLYVLMDPDAIGLETRYDQYFQQFERMVSLGEQIIDRLRFQSEYISFSYDLGYTHPMFFAAYRCRDPQLRRRAVNVLKAIPRREGNFMSLPGADIAQRIIEHEESGQSVSVAADVLESNRVWNLAMGFDFDKGELEAEFFMTPPSGIQIPTLVERVHWIPAGGVS